MPKPVHGLCCAKTRSFALTCVSHSLGLWDGLAATRLITHDEDLAGVKVLILTTFEIDEYVFEALRAGASGLPDDEIAAQLVLSPATVKTHVNRAMVKVGARDRAQLVVYAYRSGLAESV